MSGDVDLEAAHIKAMALVAECAAVVLAGGRTVTISVTGKIPRGFPRGELLSVGTNGARNYAIDPIKLLAWIRDPQAGRSQKKEG